MVRLTRNRAVTERQVPEWRQRAFDRFSEATILPMLVLTVVMVPVLILPLARHDLSPSTRNLFETLDYFIWGVFLVEYLVRLTLAPRRLHFLTHNVADLVVVAVPMLRPLRIVRSARILRTLRLGRLSALAGGGATKSKRSVASRATNYVLVVTGSLVVISSVVVLDLERSADGSTIRSFGDALWWALSTITTVGYGDHVPVTAGGKAVAAILMVSGIGLVGVITAAIAAFFVGHERAAADRMPDELAARLARIEQLLTTLAASNDRTVDVRAISVSLDADEATVRRP